MKFLTDAIAGFGMAILMLAFLGLSFWLFNQASHERESGGLYAIALAILVGTALIALAIAATRNRGGD